MPQQKQARLSISKGVQGRKEVPGLVDPVSNSVMVAESRRANRRAQESERARSIVRQVGREDVQINSSLVTTARHQLALSGVDSKANLTDGLQPSTEPTRQQLAR
jgi:hypothetical protein